MVPVSGLLHQSFAAELRRIEGALSAAASPASPGTGLALHVFRAASCSVPSSIENISKAFPSGGFHEAPKLATAGFALRWSNPSGDQLMRWREGLRRLSKRQAFTRDHQTFAFRPPELVGIALGVQVTEAEDSALREWLANVLTRFPSEGLKASAWNLMWNAYAAALLGVQWPHALPSRLDDFETVELALLLVLLSTGVPLSSPGFAGLNRSNLEQEILHRTAVSPTDEREVERLAVLYAGLFLAVRSQLEQHFSASDGLRGGTRDALQILELICRQFDRFVRTLQHRHENRAAFEVNDEYDLQDLMHGLLLLHFEVVIPEETAPARAGNKSRLDFLLKREAVVVETKMTRKSLRQSEAHDELIADRDRYKSHPDCEVLACFVYDPQHFFHNPAAFEHDLNSDEGRPRMRVFVCPH
jgi:REase_DpnII-MboI